MQDTEPKLNLLDLTLEEFEELYFTNERLFKSINNWFYFANDRKTTPLASKGYVRYGRNRGRKKALGFPEDSYGAAVLLCRSNADPKDVEGRCADEKNGVIRFELKDGTAAQYGVLNDSAGAFGPVSEKYILVMIPNRPQTKEWPYSLKGNTTFSTASSEEGTLPYDVATGAIEALIPDAVRKELRI